MQAWNDIVGQDKPKELLQRAVERDRVHHGYLFVGPAGVGKRSTALAFAQILNCVERPEDVFSSACGKCPSCRKFANDLQHPDLHLVEPTGGVNKTIKIDHVREIQKVAMTRPYEGAWQIVIFDDAHLMTEQAANALLKTLEEPPESMKLILVTDQPQALVDTIRSRCQTLRFGALEESVVVDVLKAGGHSESSEAQLAVAARYGEGSAGRAADLIESGLLEERAELAETLEVIQRSRTADLLDRANQIAKDRSQLAARLEVIGVLLRDALMWSVGVPKERLVNRDLEGQISRLAELYDADALVARVEAVRVARELLGRNVNASLVIENLATELAPGLDRAPVSLPRS